MTNKASYANAKCQCTKPHECNTTNLSGWLQKKNRYPYAPEKKPTSTLRTVAT